MMKKNLRILSLFLSAVGLMFSFITIKGENENLYISDIPFKTDTSVVNRWIKVYPFNLGIIPPSSGVQFYRDGMVFLSSSKNESKIPENQISFGKPDARIATVSDTIPENIKVFSISETFPYDCNATTFTSDFDTMYYTKYSAREGVEKIFEAVYSENGGKEGSWTFSENPLSFCIGKSNYMHPALSTDGKLIVFASDREGSIGGMDLFVSLKKNNLWSDPVNIGDAVNSTANEISPFLDSDNNLYFSSDSPQGFGGYDIYVCRFKGNTWEKPINLSANVNTEFDDVAFTINRKDGKTGFYTIMQKSGKGPQQLYKVSMNESRADTFLNLSQFFTRPDISQMVILALEPAVQATDKVSETASQSRGEKDIITYRVQFMTSFNPRTRQQISVSGKDYPVYEILFSGAYRLCIGEFSNIPAAIELRNLLRKNEYPQASILAFKNNVIYLDPELLKVTPVSGDEPDTEKGDADSANIKSVSETAVNGNKTKDLSSADNDDPQVKTVITETPEVKKDNVVYRVQILTNTSPKGNFKINIANKSYDTFEYKYSGAYRICLGEFSLLSAATEFQKICRQSGYTQAFVVAFRNNERTNEPSLFK